MSKSIYSLYQTTNTINGKIYIGVHKESSWPIIDKYLGSGFALKAAIKKYGKHNFERKILCISDSSEYVFDMESKLVTDVFVKENNNYNIICGGVGTSDFSQDTKKKISDAKKGVPLSQEHKQKLRELHLGRKCTQEQRKRMSVARRGKGNAFYGKKHKPETLEKFRKMRQDPEYRMSMSQKVKESKSKK